MLDGVHGEAYEPSEEEVIEYDVDENQTVLDDDGRVWWICGMEDDTSQGMNLTFQASDAKKPLISVRRVVEREIMSILDLSPRIATSATPSRARDCHC